MSRIVAFMPVYNEEDILIPSIQHLADEGVEVCILDNWSTDASFELARSRLGDGVLKVERFPADGPPLHHKWSEVLARIEALSLELPADWFVLNGVDEIRRAPWRGMDLAAGIQVVDGEGYNCIDYAVMEFPPVDDGYQAGTDFETYFRYYEWGHRPYHFIQRNTWKRTGEPVSLAASAGHDVSFSGRRIYPYKFLLKHYPVRSQQHGEKKILLERLPRYDPGEVGRGWNRHYDHVHRGHSFLRSPADLSLFDESTFPTVSLPDGRQLHDWAGLSVVPVIRFKERRIATMEKDLQALGACLDELAAARDHQAALLAEITQSSAWRMIERLRRIRLSFAPSGTGRERLWYRFLRLLGRAP